MIKLTILYRKPDDLSAFEAFYIPNLALMERIPGVIRREVSVVYGAPGGEAAYHRMLELYFEDKDTLTTGMTSEAGQAAGHHLMQHAAQLAELFFSEVFEEAGGSTPDALPVDTTEGESEIAPGAPAAGSMPTSTDEAR
jgi:uncharacterized protein (TIGR02118 family)